MTFTKLPTAVSPLQSTSPLDRPKAVTAEGTNPSRFAGPLTRGRGSPTAGRRFAVLSTYPPTACGLATFSSALATALEANGAQVYIVRVADGTRPLDTRVLMELTAGDPASLVAATRLLNTFDAVIVQHEYGIYGGTDGDEVLGILKHLTVPCIVVAHTVLLRPTKHQKEVLEDVTALADAVVVMGQTAKHRLLRGFKVDASKVVMIPHGATLPPPTYRPRRTGPPMLLTWGLLGRGKGIEWAIDAMASLRDLQPQYVVAGRTHPKVMAAGEAYRDMLVARARALGIGSSVKFDPAYRDLPSLTRLVQDASVVVLPYDSRDQVTSGVLVDAIAAGRPVVATAFPHAVELLSSGAGIVVGHQDSSALAHALRRVLSDPSLAASMEAEANRLAPALSWAAVGQSYAALAERILASSQIAVL